MAIGIFNKSDRTMDNDTNHLDRRSSSYSGSKSESFAGYDPESQDQKGRETGRFATPGSVTTEESKMDVGKQMELESTNSIKYRTCSWQKVILSAFPSLLSCW